MHVHRQEGLDKEASEESDNESNYSDGELWLCAGQMKFSRRSRRMSNKENSKKSQSVAHIKPKVKPPIIPKPKRQLPAGNHAGLERSVSQDDQRLQYKYVRNPLKLTSDIDNASR